MADILEIIQSLPELPVLSAAVRARQECGDSSTETLEQLVDQFNSLYARRKLALSIAGLCRAAIGFEHDAYARGLSSWPDH